MTTKLSELQTQTLTSQLLYENSWQQKKKKQKKPSDDPFEGESVI